MCAVHVSPFDGTHGGYQQWRAGQHAAPAIWICSLIPGPCLFHDVLSAVTVVRSFSAPAGSLFLHSCPPALVLFAPNPSPRTWEEHRTLLLSIQDGVNAQCKTAHHQNSIYNIYCTPQPTHVVIQSHKIEPLFSRLDPFYIKFQFCCVLGACAKSIPKWNFLKPLHLYGNRGKHNFIKALLL